MKDAASFKAAINSSVSLRSKIPSFKEITASVSLSLRSSHKTREPLLTASVTKGSGNNAVSTFPVSNSCNLTGICFISLKDRAYSASLSSLRMPSSRYSMMVFELMAVEVFFKSSVLIMAAAFDGEVTSAKRRCFFSV